MVIIRFCTNQVNLLWVEIGCVIIIFYLIVISHLVCLLGNFQPRSGGWVCQVRRKYSIYIFETKLTSAKKLHYIRKVFFNENKQCWIKNYKLLIN